VEGTRMKNGMEVVPHVRPRTTHLHGASCMWSPACGTYMYI